MKKVLYLAVVVLLSMSSSIVLTSCGDDDDGETSVSTKDLTLYVGSKTNISGAKSIVPDNKFIALVDNNLEIEGWHVGSTSLLVNGNKKINLTVRGRYHFYDDPVTDWGTSMSNVKSKQKQGTLSNETQDVLVYKNVGSAELLGYTFEKGKLKAALAQVKTSYTTSLIDYLNERYLILPEEVATYTYMGADGLDKTTMKTLVMIEVQSASYIIVYYLPYSSANKAPEAEVQKLRKKLML
ncbi:MAG: hypothetical protein IKH52_06490 [Bacteroidaceae bacterium]|nr:hypothetical protein [Bacteroidaceae bacterium]